MNKIDRFFGPYRFLSNFYPAEVLYEDILYKSSEAAFQAAKTTDIHLKKVMRGMSPAEAKHHGNALLPRRKDWDEVKFKIMSEIVLNKFSQNEELKQKLLDTGFAYLEEGNTWNDTYWGVCNGEGKNKLGLILMRTRDILRNKGK